MWDIFTRTGSNTRFTVLCICIWLLGCLFGHLAQSTIIYSNSPFLPYNEYSLSPFADWREIETENYRVIFPSELKEVANQSANYLEETFSILSPLFSWTPRYKVQVLVIDNSDLPNGLTASVLRIGMILWVTPPENWNGTGFCYDDWLRLLIMHESTHFYNMDTTSGIWKPLRYLFGDIALPNSVWAPWMLEGLAVYMETRFTTAGRGRSPYYEMILRAAVNENVFNTRSFVTLGQISGTNPYFPTGDTRYQFGYHLINQVAQSATEPKYHLNGVTKDGESQFKNGEDLLGILSERSSKRIPFFINENLKNVTGLDWYDHWNEFTQKTQQRITQDLKIIRSQPVTQVKRLNERNHETSNNIAGVAESPDGHWLAYTLISADRRSGLYLKDLHSQKITRLDDKLGGIGMQFLPDSKHLIYSEIRRLSQFTIASDLRIYSLENNSNQGLTHKLRARDPDVSKDGKWVTFTLTQTAVTGLALAPLNKDSSGKYYLGPIRKIFMPPKYGHVANPQFSPDGMKIYFSFHPNGKNQEDLYEWRRDSGQVTPLVSDGFYNRFPAVSPSGELYFISNLTGVDNLYQYQGQAPRQAPSNLSNLMTNMITGIWYPRFNSRGQLYAAVFTSSGADLAQVPLFEKPISPKSVTILPPPAPPIGEHSLASAKNKIYSDTPYSIFPSIYPRGWTPLLGIGPLGSAIGAELGGFDTVDRHRYLLAASYVFQVNQADWFALYSNRSLGPDFEFSIGQVTNNITPSGNSTLYARQLNFSATSTFPIMWTYSSLIPTLSFNLQQSFNYQATQNISNPTLTSSTPTIPSFTGSLEFTNLETSSLAITSEGGRDAVIGVDNYLIPGANTWKGLLMDQENIRLTRHTILSPSARLMMTSVTNSAFTYANAVLSGRTLNLFGPFQGNNFNQLSIRGYPNYLYVGRAAATGALDLAIPLLRVYRGWGTNLAFLDNLYGVAFIEASLLSTTQLVNLTLPSAGGGIRLSTEIFYVPITFSADYQYGFNQAFGGAKDLFFQIMISNLLF